MLESLSKTLSSKPLQNYQNFKFNVTEGRKHSYSSFPNTLPFPFFLGSPLLIEEENTETNCIIFLKNNYMDMA